MLPKALLLGAFAALAAAQSAVLTFTRVPNPITDGEPQAITYSTNDTVSPVTIILRKGAANNLQTVDTLTTDAVGGQFIWTPPPSLPNGIDYALEIRQAGQVNYFGPLTIQGAVPASVSAYASATAANATTSKTSMTMTGGTISMGTGTTMPRNTTMVKPTISTKTTSTRTTSTGTGTNGGASFQGSPTGSSPSSSSSGAATSDYSAHSSFALVFGALAAVFYLG